MEKSNSYYQQLKTLLKISESIKSKMEALVGESIPGERSEKFLLYISYEVEKCNQVPISGTYMHYWDIPRYCNGTTRHAKCLFLVPCHAVADAMYPYLIRDNSEMEAKYLKDIKYDREKVLINEYFGNDLISIVWSFDYKKPNKEGNWYYSIDNFWFGVKKNGVLISKEKEIKKLIKTTF